MRRINFISFSGRMVRLGVSNNRFYKGTALSTLTLTSSLGGVATSFSVGISNSNRILGNGDDGGNSSCCTRYLVPCGGGVNAIGLLLGNKRGSFPVVGLSNVSRVVIPFSFSERCTRGLVGGCTGRGGLSTLKVVFCSRTRSELMPLMCIEGVSALFCRGSYTDNDYTITVCGDLGTGGKARLALDRPNNIVSISASYGTKCMTLDGEVVVRGSLGGRVWRVYHQGGLLAEVWGGCVGW